MRKTLVNIFYNVIYQVFLVLIPLITVPYVSRTLGPDQYGIYSTFKFTVQFLIIICTVAMSFIGTRTIAKIRATGNQQQVTAAFWGMWYLQFIASFLVIVITVVLVTILKIPNLNLFYLEIPLLLSAMFDISWFFQGIANFGRVVLRNTLVKLATVVLIFAFVKSPADLWKYFLISSVCMMLGSFAFWLSLHRYVGKPTWKFYQLKDTLRAIGVLLLPQIAIQVYTSLDKPILALFKSSREVAFYDNSQRISTMILGVITAITIVMMPKMAITKKSAQQIFLKKTYETSLALGLLFAAIIMVNTKEFVPFFFGEKFVPMTPLMFASTLTIILIPVGSVFANQFALANKRDRDFAVPVIIGAIISLLLGLLLDPIFGAAGAMLTVITTEFIVCLLRIWIVRDAFDFGYVFRDTLKYVLIAVVTIIAGALIPQIIQNTFLDMAFRSILMMLVYALLFWLGKFELKDDVRVLLQKMGRS